jgi:hypothetical protein
LTTSTPAAYIVDFRTGAPLSQDTNAPAYVRCVHD